MPTIRFPDECTEAGTEAAMAALAGWVGITVVGIGGVVVVVGAAAAVVVELLELLEHAEATTTRAPRAMAATTFFTPRFEVRTGEPPGCQGCEIETPKCATRASPVCTPRELGTCRPRAMCDLARRSPGPLWATGAPGGTTAR